VGYPANLGGILVAGFSHQAWTATEKVQQAVLEHPFIAELSDGSLSRERFQFYLAQDARYLVGFGRALAVAAARAVEPDDLAFFAGAAQDTVLVERTLHEAYFAGFGLSEADLAAIEESPTCSGYTSFLLATAQTEGYPELIASVLPCFWVYQYVGTEILARQRDHESNPYRAWIDTYADDDFAAAVNRCREAVDRAADTADGATWNRMLARFTRACEYEWLFWDSAYRLESWPTARFLR
jgi:thiaminase/transcriptional activator TenA